MAKKNYKNKSAHNKQGLDIIKLTTYFLTIIICAGLIFNGYFFENQSLTVSILTTAFFVIFLYTMYKKQIPLYYDKKTALLGLAFLVINIIGLFTASNTREALGNVLIITTAILIYFLASQSLREKENLNIFFKGFYWTTVFIALLGLLSFIFGVNILNSYSGNRLFSTLEYPNTAALVFIAAIFTGNYLMKNTLKSPSLFLFSNSILFLAFIGTKSRGVFLIAPLLLIIYILLQDKENRLKATGDFLLFILPSIIIAPVVYNGTFANRELNSILISLVGLLILFAFYYFVPRFIVKKNIKIISILTLLLLVIVGGYLVTQQDLLSNNVFSRLTKINLSERSVQERFLFMQDAIKIAKDNLLLGTGAGGWNAEYRSYRSFLYFTSEVHNHYLQVLVENGILGFFAYLGLWFFLILNLWRKFTTEKSNSSLLLMVIALGLMLHSMIDFDLTYPAIYFIFWILIALSLNTSSVFQGLNKQSGLIIGLVPLVLLLVINTSLLIGWSYGRDGTRLMAQNNILNAIEKLERSITLDPVNPTYLTNLSQLYLAKGINDNDQEYKDKALNTINKAIKNNPTNFEWHIIKTRFLVELGKYEEAYQTALQAIKCAPLEEVVYYDTARFFIDAEKKEAIKYAEEIIKLAYNEGEKIKKNSYEKFWHGTKLHDSSRLAFLEGEINFKQENFDMAKAKFAQALTDKTLADEAKKYLKDCYVLTENYLANGSFKAQNLAGWNFNGEKGEKRELANINDQFWMHITKDNKETTWWGFNQLIYDFKPGKKYKLFFDAFSDTDEGRLVLIVHQVGPDGINPQKSATLTINNKAKNYNWIFQTDNLENKDTLRIHLLVPNDEKEQDIYISNVRLTTVE